jgi:hypothetical protein
MANYTSTTLKFTEAIGDSVIGLNMISSGVITISPKSGYVVTASDFSVATLPDNITSVVFANTGTAGQPGNTVTATVTLGPLFTVSANKTVNLNISGDAKIYNPNTDTVSVNFLFIDDSNTNTNGANVITGVASGFTVSSATSGGIKTDTISGSVTKNTLTKICTVTISATNSLTSKDYYFPKKPYLQYFNITDDNLTLRQTRITRDSDNRILAYKFDLMFNGNFSTNSSVDKVMLIYNAKAVQTSTTEIKAITFGGSEISSFGGTKNIIIYGEKNAEFDLAIVKDSTNTSIIEDYNYNAKVFDYKAGLCNGFSRKFLSDGSFSFQQVFPELSFVLSTLLNGTYSTPTTTLNIDDDEGLQVGDRVIQEASGVRTITASKITEMNPGSVANRIVVSPGITGADDSVIKFQRTEKYYVNIYPKTGTTLGSKIPTDIPSYTINQYINPTLLIRATTANVNLNATLATDILYTGKPNAYPSELRHATSLTREKFQISYALSTNSAKTFNSQTTPTWSSTVQGSSSWTNSVYADNGGTHLEMTNIIVTRAGDNLTATVTADVIIKKWGTEPVSMVLDLDTVLTTTS